MKILVEKNLTAQEVMSHYHVSRATAYRALKVGHLVKPDAPRPNPRVQADELYRLARAVCVRVIRTTRGPDADDLIQAAVLKLFERSGDPNFVHGGYRYAVAYNAARDEYRRLAARAVSLEVIEEDQSC